MKILAAGDSFTFGEGLENKNKAFPYLLGEKFKAEVINTGHGGYSNQSIMREIVDNFDNTIDLVIVGFASPGRIEMSDEFGIFNIWPGRNYNDKIKNLYRNQFNSLISICHNNEWLFSNFYRTALMLESFLLYRGKPFLFYCLDNFYDYYFKNYPNITDKYKSKFLSTNSQLIFNYNESIVMWQKNNKLPCNHPNEVGHQLIAERIYEHCRNICGIS